ncbi:LPS assembly lipoprotein LptE [Desulfobacterales bacterium HSG16]|nr:LPS assembly lipoprotein LptE [Desulfobacterales bacterium HSG16]
MSVCFSFGGCGYRFSGPGLPEEIRSVCIELFKNRTMQTGIESVFANHLISEFQKNSDVRILTSPGQAATVLSGQIDSISVSTISHRGQHTPTERRVTCFISLKLTDLSTKKVMWSAKKLRFREAYNVIVDNKMATERNRYEAIVDISERFAEDVYLQIANESF